MSSGLILAGIGKGIADAGSVIGNSMFKAIDADLAEQRVIQRQETLDEMRRQRTIKDSVSAEEEAVRIAEKRSGAQLDANAAKIAGVAGQVKGDAPAMSAEEIKQLIKDNPQYAETYRKSGLIDKAMTPEQQRVQAADDRVQGALNIGAHSSVVEAYQKARKDVLDQIREENKDRRDQARLDQNDRRLDLMEERITSQNKTDEIRANKPSGGGGKGKTDTTNKPPTGIDLERSAKAAKQALALELGVPEKEVAEKVAQLRKNNKLTGEAQTRLDAYNSALTKWQNYKTNLPSSNSNSSDNSTSRPSLDSFRR